MNHTRARTTAVGLTVLATLALAGCGGQGGDHAGHAGAPTTGAGHTAPATAGAHNAADVAFAQQMIPHHRQAVEMARMAEGKAGPEVAALAERIAAAQGPEITTMTGWLLAWGEPTPTTDGAGDHGGHGDHGSMPGMMSAADMSELRRAVGDDFDRMWLEMMIRHHEGAVAMARTEQERGADPEARRLAGEIAAAQRSEIAEMRELLGQG